MQNAIWNSANSTIEKILSYRIEVYNNIKNVEFNDNPLFSLLVSLQNHYLNYVSSSNKVNDGESFVINYLQPIINNIDKDSNNCYMTKYIKDEKMVNLFSSLIIDLRALEKSILSEINGMDRKTLYDDAAIEMRRLPNGTYNISDFYGKIND